MDLHQLRVFRTAALREGFTRASEELHLSQSTVSLHIKQLETELGCPLFRRVGRRVVLSPAGRLLLEHSEKIFRDLKNAEMAVRETQALREGTVRFGAGATTLIYRLAGVLSTYRRRFPRIELIIKTDVSEKLIQEVKAQRLDLSLIMMPAQDVGLEILPVGREEMVVVLHRDHPLCRKSALTPEDLQGLSFIFYEPQSSMQSVIDRWFSNLGVIPHVAMQMENVEAIKALLRAQLGAGVLPLCALRNQARSDPLRALRVRGATLIRQLAIVTADGGIRPKAIQALIDLIAQHLIEGGSASSLVRTR